ncbi:adenosylcobinamide amidohydrolase [Pelotomaculum sp. FP]|uniref:adenosylcobinamide amidohydrolase n=1 Tax=Pelotomaculum sp. FP TaxID=261474 RepID=UPI001064862D|nr:adenosylcobinamide amidohydrolase [Pelotomaculum sp. FP]
MGASLTPEEQTTVEYLLPESGRWISPGLGLRAMLGPQTIFVDAGAPWVSISSAVVGGGLGPKRYFVNRQVEPGYHTAHPADEAASFLADTFPEYHASDSGQWLALMTAARVSDACWVRLSKQGCQALVIVSAGVSNACAAGITPDCLLDTVTPNPGTINIMAFLSHALSPGALVNAVQTATEAKTQTLRELGIKCPDTGAYASGTTTDALVIAGAAQTPAAPYAGPGTLAGYLLARGVRQGLSQALRRYLTRAAEESDRT